MDAPVILLVDDEESLLPLLEKYLTRLGYAVKTSVTAEQAWNAFSTAPQAYSLVIADLSLPDMPGQELLRKMLELAPETRILVCSGYPFRATELPGVKADIEFLQKPFLPKVLGEKVNAMLNRTRSTSA
ncbi:MAG: response regulator [Bryobacteraceae bacterium]